MDSVQIIFLWERRIKVTLLGGKIPESESRTDSEAGMEMGGGGAGWTQGHTFRKGIPMSRGEDCVEFNQWVCNTGKRQPHTDISMKRASLLWAGGSRRAAVKGKMRKNVSLVHQEL